MIAAVKPDGIKVASELKPAGGDEPCPRSCRARSCGLRSTTNWVRSTGRSPACSFPGKEGSHARNDQAPYGRKTQRAPAVKEVHVLWITAGLGCDGDSVSITAATQPSIEDVVLGAIPGLPKVHLHNPVLAYENGDEFMKFWYQADGGTARARSCWSSKARSPTRRSRTKATGRRSGTDKQDRPADHDLRVDRPPGPQGAGGRGGRHLRHLRRHPRDGGQPDRLHGPGRLPGLGLEVEGGPADRQRAGLSRCSPTTSWRRCSTCSIRWRAWPR